MKAVWQRVVWALTSSRYQRPSQADAPRQTVFVEDFLVQVVLIVVDPKEKKSGGVGLTVNRLPLDPRGVQQSQIQFCYA